MTHPYPPLLEQRCSNCRYSRLHYKDELTCRRNTPRFQEIDIHGDTCLWPVVCDTLWCGEWAPLGE